MTTATLSIIQEKAATYRCPCGESVRLFALDPLPRGWRTVPKRRPRYVNWMTTKASKVTYRCPGCRS